VRVRAMLKVWTEKEPSKELEMFDAKRGLTGKESESYPIGNTTLN
jgi:hypothetical protein